MTDKLQKGRRDEKKKKEIKMRERKYPRIHDINPIEESITIYTRTLRKRSV